MVKIVRVEWVDSEAREDGWIARRDFQEFADEQLGHMVSVGLLWTDCSDYIVLIQNISPDCVSGNIKIPKAAVIDIQIIGESDVPEAA